MKHFVLFQSAQRLPDAALEAAICAWVEWFNERRLHGELLCCTPAAVEATYYASHPHAVVA